MHERMEVITLDSVQEKEITPDQMRELVAAGAVPEAITAVNPAPGESKHSLAHSVGRQ